MLEEVEVRRNETEPITTEKEIVKLAVSFSDTWIWCLGAASHFQNQEKIVIANAAGIG